MEQNGGPDGPKFYFHCENELLKYNNDYQLLLRTLGRLEAQKIQAIKDLELLEELKSKTHTNSDDILTKLRNGTLSLPTRQSIVSVPEINWEKYGDSHVAMTTGSYNMRKTRKTEVDLPSCSYSSNDNNNDSSISSNHDKVTKSNSGTTTSNKGKQLSASNKGKQPSASNKGKQPNASNKGKQSRCPWTVEEQSKLEELLKIHPPEEIEAKRWEKIAYHLPNRTAKQVCCRVQKYFIKLAKAGLPVPGRMPNLASYTRKGRLKRAARRVTQQSIFLNSYKPRVYMDSKDLEEEDEDLSSDDDGSSGSAPSPLTTTGSTSLNVVCSGCGLSLLCVYWECVECEGEGGDGMVLCQNCVNSQWTNGSHCPSHEMKQVQTSQEKEAFQYIDKDYTGFTPSQSHTSYNYLDPNFHPAV